MLPRITRGPGNPPTQKEEGAERGVGPLISAVESQAWAPISTADVLPILNFGRDESGSRGYGGSFGASAGGSGGGGLGIEGFSPKPPPCTQKRRPMRFARRQLAVPKGGAWGLLAPALEVEQEVAAAIEGSLDGWHTAFASRIVEQHAGSNSSLSGVESIGAFRELRKDEEGSPGGSSCSTQNSPGAVPEPFKSPVAALLSRSEGAAGMGDSEQEQPLIEVPQGSHGVIIAGELCELSTLTRMVASAIKDSSSLPVVSLLFVAAPTGGDSPSSQTSEDRRVQAVLQAQAALLDAGADDVIVRQNACTDSLRLELAMSAKRAERRRNDFAVMKDAISQVQAQAREREMTLADEDARDGAQHNKLFWSCVHRIFDGFPKIEPQEIPENLGPGDIVGTCELDELLGEGGFGCVYAAINTETQTTEAIKVLQKTTIQDLAKVRNTWREFTVLHKIRHPGIIRLLRVTHTRHHVCIHMELAGTTTMCDFIMDQDTLTSAQTWDLGEQITAALAYLHRIGIAHRDVKHDNVVLSCCDKDANEDKPKAKLVDFGMALEVSKARAEGQCGTMPFAAPEILQGMKPSFDPCAGDVWAFGVLILDALHGVGKMCRLLGWPEPASVSAERGDELAHFWTRPGEDRVRSLGGIIDQTGALASGAIDREFVELLLGIFSVDIEYRWVMDEVAEWFGARGHIAEAG